MKFALVDGKRQEPQPKISGQCIGCGNPVVSKCGEVRVPHWAHKGRIQCDTWWENETEWHRSWKNQFPTDWQEIIHQAEDGERHIADVKTNKGWVIEFQHSYINPEERRSRENFYKKLIWVVDGSRRARDKSRFDQVLGEGDGHNRQWPQLKMSFPEGAIFRDWITSNAHVIYDFGEDNVWWLFPESDELWAYVLPIPKLSFIEMHRDTGLNLFDQVIHKFNIFLIQHKSPKYLTRGF